MYTKFASGLTTPKLKELVTVRSNPTAFSEWGMAHSFQEMESRDWVFSGALLVGRV